jgi:DNA-binding MarR family transcriptional regulator
MGEKNKLSSADMTKIRVMREHGMLLKDIAKEFDVTTPAIFFALRRLEQR